MYILPQVRVFEEFGQVPSVAVQALNPFIYGPHYILFRYNKDNEKIYISVGDYNKDVETSYEFPSQPANSSVDKDYVKVYVDNAHIEYATLVSSEDDPIVLDNSSERNKLRATPHIKAFEMPANTGVTLGNLNANTAPGYFIGKAELPESFYFVPYGGYVSTGWASNGWKSDFGSQQSGALKYATPDGGAGVVQIEGTQGGGTTPLTSNENTVVPDLGIQLNFDTGSRYVITVAPGDSYGGTDYENSSGEFMSVVMSLDNVIDARADSDGNVTILSKTNALNEVIENAIYAPRTLKVENAGGEYFILRPKESAMATIAEYSIEGKPLTIKTSTDSLVYDELEHTVGINTGLDLVDAKNILANNSDVSALFDIMGTDTNEGGTPSIFTNVNWGGTAISMQGEYLVLLDVFKTVVEPNQYTFKTANGFDRSANFYNRDVQSGDVLRYLVEASETGETIECTTEVIDVQYDMLLPKVTPVTLDAGNIGYNDDQVQGTDVAATKLLAGTLNSNNASPIGIIDATSDNQKEFNGPGSGIKILSPLYGAYLGDLSNGIIEDTYTITVITGGLPGVATCSVLNASGTYRRVNVPIEAFKDADGTIVGARVYLGDNIYAHLTANGGDYDFKVRDAYTFSKAVSASYDAIDTRSTYSGGQYNGDVDTVYRAEVIRGGVFNRSVVSFEGLQANSSYKITPTNASTSINIEFQVDGGVGSVQFSGTILEIAESISKIPTNGNETDLNGVYRAELVDSDSALVITAPYEYLVNGGVDKDFDGVAVRNIVNLNAGVKDSWNAYPGDIDDEYILTAAGSGALSSVRFNSSSTRGDGKAGIKVAEEDSFVDIGNNNIQVSFSNDRQYRVRFTYSSGLYAQVKIGDNIYNAASAEDLSNALKADGIEASSAGSYVYITISEDVSEVIGIDATLSGTFIPVTPYETTAQTQIKDDAYWVIKVFASRPLLSITDSAGVDVSSTVIVNNDGPINLGLYGATIKFEDNNNNYNRNDTAGGGLAKGEIFYVSCEAAAPGPCKTLVIADDVSSNVKAGRVYGSDTNSEFDTFAVWLYTVKNGLVIPERAENAPAVNWSVAMNVDLNDEITLDNAIQVQLSDIHDSSGYSPYLDLYSGEVLVEYRALLKDYTDGIYSITEIGDITDMLGQIDPDNPLAYGLYKCMENSADRIVYFMGTPSDDQDGYLECIDMAAKHPDLYALAPMTQDKDIHDMLKAHVVAMSTEEVQRWRRGVVGMAMPATSETYTKDQHPNQVDWAATIVDDTRFPGAQYRKLVMDDATNACKFLEDVRPGDSVRYAFSTDGWGGEVYLETKVAQVESNTVLYLDTTLDNPISNPSKVEIYRIHTVQEQADILAAQASNYGERRINAIVPPYLGTNGDVVTSEFAAAAIAGLMCSVPPQQGLTNIEVNGFDDLSLCYRIFNRAQLDKMAENGAFILMQEVASGRVFVRHQVTTNQDGNLMKNESSINTNFDSVAYYFADLLKPYYGRYNITPEIIRVIRTQINYGIGYLASQTSVGLLGPQVLLEDATGDKSEILVMEQHPTLKDHLYCKVHLVLPVPLNSLDLHLVV